MLVRVVHATPLLFGLWLKVKFGYVFDEGACDADEKILLYDFPGSHAFAEHKKLALFLILDVLWEKDDTEVIDSALDFGLGLLEIKQFINELHVGYRFLRVPDYYYLVVFCRKDPFHCGDFVQLWNFFFYIYHI